MTNFELFFSLSLISILNSFTLDFDGALKFPWYPRCTSFTNTTPALAQCCHAASYSFSVTDRHNCARECLEDGGDACCYDICFAERLEIFVDEQIRVEGFVSAITNGKGEIEGIKKLAEDAVEECKEGYATKYPFAKDYNNLITCEMPDKLYMISKCVLAFIFKNCPHFSEHEGCEEVKKAMGNCEELTTTVLTTPTTTIAPTIGFG